MKRPVTTLFMLMSVDGKISTGATDEFDFDKDLPHIHGVCEGLRQYYEAEQESDLWSLNTGRVMAKIGANTTDLPTKTPVSFAILDNSHLTAHGVRWLCAKTRELVLITSNTEHPAFNVDEGNLHIMLQSESSLTDALSRLREDFGCERLTIQSGATLNGAFLRQKLLDYVDIIVAPLLVGGKDTPSLVDGRSLTTGDDLSGLGVLALEECTALEDSYVRLRYRVVS